MKKYAIDLDITKCISCGACSVACMDQNDFQVKEGQRPFRNVFDLEMEQKGNVKYSHLSLACMHCSDAPCISACPSACLKKDPETNLTVYDTTNCIGCHSCAMASTFPASMFSFNPLIGGTSGTEPVAFTTISGLNCFTFSTVASVFRKT